MKRRVLGLLLATVIALGALGPVAVQADGINIIGQVTITHYNNVNIRSGGSTDYPVVATGAPGQEFPCTGFATSGWYEIILPDNTIGYVTNNLSLLTYYAKPIPWGGGTDPIQASVLVQYITNFGQSLHSEYVRLSQGTHYVSANDARVPVGYALSGARVATVTVNASGVASPASITFVYVSTATQPPVTNPPAQYATVPIYYKNLYGAVLYTDYAYLAAGSRLISANSNLVPAGYVLVGAKDAVISVSAYGVASPSSVTFLCSRATTDAPAPVSVMVPVYYRSNTGTALATAYATAVPGNNTITANSSLVPSGYVLSGASSAQVYVASNGVATPSSVTFIYVQAATNPPVITANLPVYYQDTQGNLLKTTNVQVGFGANTIYANDSNVPAGYTLAGNRAAVVEVAANGTVNPSSVTFVYRPNVTAVVPVTYVEEGGATLHTENVTLGYGSSAITANDARVPSGYMLVSTRSVAITVNESGTATPANVKFTYRAPAPPVSVNVPVIYKNQDGAQLASLTVLASSAQPTQVKADPAHAPKGYVLTSPATVTVTVSPDGTATPAQVVFTYQDPTTFTEPQYLPEPVKTKLNKGSWEVYTGPGPQYYRNGSASAGGNSGTARVYGTIGEWVMIGYGLSKGNYRIGFISNAAIPANVLSQIPALIITRQPRTTTGAVYFTDDPVSGLDMDRYRMEYYGNAGVNLNVLAWRRDNNSFWAYVEIPNFREGKPAWGFVARRKL